MFYNCDNIYISFSLASKGWSLVELRWKIRSFIQMALPWRFRNQPMVYWVSIHCFLGVPTKSVTKIRVYIQNNEIFEENSK